MIEAKIIEDSVSKYGTRLTTFQLKYPRYIHAELMTHRVFSRNASSSRAIPSSKLVEAAMSDMVFPVRYGKNQAGMQARVENLSDVDTHRAAAIWHDMAEYCANGVAQLADLGLHKQWANRPLEWFGHISVVLSTTETDNWYALRDHPAAMDEIQILARTMRDAADRSNPVPREYGEWHLPYITLDDRVMYNVEMLIKMSAARCARVSYLKHDGTQSSIEEDFALYDRLVKATPPHMSPVEHQATPGHPDLFYGNFKCWKQHRKFLEETM